MELRIFVEPQQGATYSDQLAVARTAEAAGFGAFFRSDHYLAMNVEGSPGPTDTWTTLAGLARETSTIRLGTLVTSATFRYPGPLAIAVAQVDEMSGGRVEFGYGAGWFSAEHEAYAIPFPSLGARFDKLEESLAVITGLWKTPVGEKFSYSGEYYTVKDSPALPKPVQTPMPPIVLGGQGKKRTPALAAQYADEFNVPFISAGDAQQAFDRVRQACEVRGRAAEDLIYSAALTVCAGVDDAEVARRATNIGRDLAELRKDGLAGSPAEIVDKIGSYREIGASRIYLQVLDMSDLGHLEFIADKVIRQL
ncbi:LLM class F420-dependent oxidoreductase [Williamsia sp. 1135]|uniref:LLM class F420-dependent oxidoreductase n=1 Tax=Williamsia sp. 1135 TaxID=1889262 RepID=UPI000A122A3F|nr:LLM class F420-dependent oxidoreductase [Williamsia sp. 1135]ORM34551.1 LLM class F420-dependent oxidoreductase [Williamsia sp. 1135]